MFQYESILAPSTEVAKEIIGFQGRIDVNHAIEELVNHLVKIAAKRALEQIIFALPYIRRLSSSQAKRILLAFDDDFYRICISDYGEVFTSYISDEKDQDEIMQAVKIRNGVAGE